MLTKNDLDGLCQFINGKPVSEAIADYPSDPIKIKTAPHIVRYIKKMLNPRTCLDLGCGTGVYVEEFNNQGVKTIGIEGNLAVKPILKTLAERVIFHDLRAPLNLKDRYELVMCIEVIEHIDEIYLEVLLHNLTNFTDKWLLITTGADSHGTNREHLNEQPFEYWLDKITARGFTYKEAETMALRKNFRKVLTEGLIKKRVVGLTWFFDLLFLFEKK